MALSEEQRLKEVLDRTTPPSPDLFAWASIVGLICAVALLVVGYFSSTRTYLILAAAAFALGVFSANEGRLWSFAARRRFVRNAVKEGLSAELAKRYWDELRSDKDEFE